MALRHAAGRAGQLRPRRPGARRAARAVRAALRRGARRGAAQRPARGRVDRPGDDLGRARPTSAPSASATASPPPTTTRLLDAPARAGDPARGLPDVQRLHPLGALARRAPAARARRGRRAGDDQLRRPADVLDDAQPRVRGRRRAARPRRGRRRRRWPAPPCARRSSTSAGKAALLAEIDEYADGLRPDGLSHPLDYPGRRARSVHLPPRAGHDPARAGRLQVPRRARPGHLRRQGEEPAAAAELLLRRRRPALHPRTRQMVTSAASVEWTVVRTEVEALQLEYTWIKEFDPRFNVRYRDDKSYPSLAVTLYEEFPRLQVMRGPKRKGVRYFGPYCHAWAIRETLDLLLRVFPARTCSRRRVQARRPDRPALPARLHRQVQRAVRRPGQRRRAPRDRRRLLRLHGRQDRPDDAAARAADGRGEREPRVRAGRPAARRPRGAAPGDGEAGRRVRRRHRRRRRRLRRGRARGGGAGLPRPRRPGARPARLGRRQARRDDHRRPRRAVRHPVLRRCSTRTTGSSEHPARGPGAGAARRRRRADRVAQRAARLAGAACGCRSAATSARWPRRSPATPRSRCTSTSSSAPPTSPRARGRSANCRRRSSCRRAAAHRVLRHQPRAGHQRRRAHGRVRGRPGPQERVPPLRDARRAPATPTGSPRSSAAGSRATSTSRSTTGADADSDPAAEAGRGRRAARHRPDHRPAAEVRLPAEPARRRRRRAAGGGGAGRARRAGHRRRRAGRAGQAARGGLAARASSTRRSCRARPRGCTCCSGCATRRTGSRSPSTARSGRRR